MTNADQPTKTMLTEVEKQEIRQAAAEYSLKVMAGSYNEPMMRDYIAGATAWAEKVEGLREDLQFVTEGFMNVKAQLESTQAELSRLKVIAEKMVPILERLLKGVQMYGVQTEIYVEGKEVLTLYQTLLEGEKK